MEQPVDRISEESRSTLDAKKKRIKVGRDIDTFEGISYDCCDESVAATSPKSASSIDPKQTKIIKLSSKLVKTSDEHEDENHQCEDCVKLKQGYLFSNTILLITTGLAATVSIVLLELLIPDSLASITITLALATSVQILLGGPFYYRFFRAIGSRKRLTTDMLVVLSTSVAYFYSVFNVLVGSDLQFFEASSSVLTIFTIGEYLETRVLRTTSESLRNLLALKPKYAVVIRNGKQQEINSDEVTVGDIVIVKPGEKIATDGIVVEGESSIDESLITGESIPVDKQVGSKVIGGTFNKSGYLQFKATMVGSNTMLASIIEMVRRAKMSKAPVQRIADRAVQYFIPIVLSVAVGASLYWIVLEQESVSFAVTVFATILVVSCPCALGIATPMVISLGIDKAARHGVLIKGGEYLEKLSSVDIVVFDKTGTITKGIPEVTDIIANLDGNYDEYKVLQLASSIELKSEHPIARAIIREAEDKSIRPLEITTFSSISGTGVLGIYQQTRVYVGSPHGPLTVLSNNNKDLERIQRIPESIQTRIEELETEGKTVIAVFADGKPIGLIGVADTLRQGADNIIREIKRLGKDVLLLSGDNMRTTNTIAKRVGIDKFMAQVLPQDKKQMISKLKAEGKVVMMVGDGVNDAPALADADIGIAIGSGTDVAISSGHVILMKGDLEHVLYALKLGSYSLKKIKQNLGISFAYNVVTICIAAGVFYSFTNSLILTPALAALGWVISDTVVFGNSLLLRRFNGSTLETS